MQTITPNVVEFKVFRKSENLNSFCLRGYWIMDRNGNAYEFATSDYNELNRGDVVKVVIEDGCPRPYDRDATWEIPHFRGVAPVSVIDIVWGRPVNEW
jgi:hypothetical protein